MFLFSSVFHVPLLALLADVANLHQISFSEIAMQRFYKPWLVSDFIFRRSSYAAKYKKSLNILQNFTMKVGIINMALFDVCTIFSRKEASSLNGNNFTN